MNTLARRMREWSAQCAGDAISTEIALGGECNDLQVHAQVTEHLVLWPGDFARPGRCADQLRDLTVGYDAARDALIVTGPEGRQRWLNYYGSVYVTPGYGPEYILMALIQPYEAWQQKESVVPSDLEMFFHLPRDEQDGIVFNRSTWFIKAEHIREHWFKYGDARDIVEIRRDCSKHGSPTRFFAKAFVRGAHEDYKAHLDARKPQWIDVDNPLCLALLKRLLDVSEWIEIVEILPDGEDMACTPDGRHAAEIQLEMMI